MFEIPTWAVPAATAVAGFLLAFLWNRFWRKRDDRELSDTSTLKTHGDQLISIDQRVHAIELRDDARQETIGRLEEQQNRLDGKVGGLQDFWRSEFGKLRDELRQDQSEFRAELRADQASMETRLTSLMTGHQQRVHERLNAIAVDQAKMLTEFVDSVVDKRGG